jgi:hypothetical protein
MTYRIPQFDGDFANFNESEYRQQINAAIHYNRATFEAMQDLHVKLMQLARQLYGANSRQVAYLKRAQPKPPPDLEKKSWKPTIRKYTKWIRNQIEKKKRHEYRQRVRETNDLLQEHGYNPDEHYKESRAITFAKEVLITDDDGNVLEVRGLPESIDT